MPRVLTIRFYGNLSLTTGIRLVANLTVSTHEYMIKIFEDYVSFMSSHILLNNELNTDFLKKNYFWIFYIHFIL